MNVLAACSGVCRSNSTSSVCRLMIASMVLAPRDRDDDVDQRHAQRVVQAGVAEHAGPVVQAVEDGRLDQVVVGEAQHEGGHDGARRDEQQSGEPGREEHESGLVVLLVAQGSAAALAHALQLAESAHACLLIRDLLSPRDGSAALGKRIPQFAWPLPERQERRREAARRVITRAVTGC
ncbi:hypothetical protein [Nonomuraea sp. NPDC050643]|uniref:hypothetical protein n=1 Tax=Nonomuraea sp. NPDC050643 TaxID=3155660 RepID=UPI00340F1DDD